MARRQVILILFVAIIFGAKSDDNSDANTDIHRPIFCPFIKCLVTNCANGFIINQYGCETCECNPSKFGQPLFKYPCGQGQNRCASNGVLCKISNFDNAYCCPNERPGCCPPVPFPQVIFCVKPSCQNDAECKIGQKCCAPCSRCVNATLS